MNPFGSAVRSALSTVAVTVLLANAPRSEATTYNVTTASQLVSAVASANAHLGPDTINLAPGLYVLGPEVTPLDVTDDLVVNGGGRPGTVLDGTGVGGSAFSIHQSFSGNPANGDIHATFNDLTIQNFHPGIDCTTGSAGLLFVNRTTITGSGTNGLELAGGPVEILNSTISGNDRGVLVESGDSLVFDDVTIVDNVESGVEKYGGPLSVRNSIIARNGTDCSGRADAADHDLDGDGSCGPGFTTADAQLGALADNGGPTPTYALPAGSPAIDAGSGGEPVDQRGVTRPQGRAGDIGAFEWTSLPFTSVSATLAPGGSLTTDTLGTGATSAHPVQTSLTAPGGGSITIDQGPGAAGFGFIGQNVHISASPDATPANPFVIAFTIDASVIPSGQSAATIVVDKNSVAVPPCGATPGVASPDPCVASRQTIAGGDAQITVLSSTASLWDFSGGSTTTVAAEPLRLEFAIFPSPIRHAAGVQFTLPAATDADLSLFDAAGRRVAVVFAGRYPAGRYSVTWGGAEHLPAGLYFARFRAGREVRTATVVRVN